jgi:hypothetical protein
LLAPNRYAVIVCGSFAGASRADAGFVAQGGRDGVENIAADLRACAPARFSSVAALNSTLVIGTAERA